MSGKIKAKDLSYDSTLPPFLQRLRAQHSGYGEDKDPDRHERQLARPKKAKNPDDDDGPTFVDESGDTISKEEYEKLSRPHDGETGGNVQGDFKGDEKPEVSGVLPADLDSGKRADQKVTDGTTAKKRKVGKIVGEGKNEDEWGSNAGKVVKKAKKKAKPIKLAFDDD